MRPHISAQLALAAIALTTTFVTVGLAWSASPTRDVLRHAYFVPVWLAALRFGFIGGVLTAIAAILLAAPLVLPDIEVTGLSSGIVDALVTYPLVLLGGWLAGALAADARRQRARYDLVVETQRTLSGGPALPAALERVRARLAEHVGGHLALVLRDGDDTVVCGPATVAPDSLAARALAQGTSIFVRDVGTAARPRRAFATPLLAGGETIGALVVEREGELGPGERASLEALGAHIGLALENARLASVQRRFNDELVRRVAEATARAVAVDRAKSAFVATASHELRTPLTALQGFGELLATRTFPPAEVRRLAGVIRAEAERLARIVADLLDLARLERGLGPVLRRAPVRVEAAVAAAVDVFRGDGRHHLVVACDVELPVVDVDPDALDRVLRNLLSNAIKYAPTGSEIAVSARAVEGGVELAIADAGPGIAPDALPHVFEPYFRAPGTAATAAGTGIGLAVVKSLVEAHGGTIQLASAPGRGTRATVVLPRYCPNFPTVS